MIFTALNDLCLLSRAPRSTHGGSPDQFCCLLVSYQTLARFPEAASREKKRYVCRSSHHTRVETRFSCRKRTLDCQGTRRSATKLTS